jgi:Kef-type K+ transport system membrane component KefB
VLDDVASLILVAVLVPIVAENETHTLLGIGIILFKAIGFFVFIYLCAISIFPTKERRKVKRDGAHSLSFFVPICIRFWTPYFKASRSHKNPKNSC